MGVRVITEPGVVVVGRQVVDWDAVALAAPWGPGNGGTPAEALCEVAGRTCYQSFASPRPGGNAEYLRHILVAGHGSVLEHAVWNLLIGGVSRSLTHELVRHRVGWSYSELSQRYVDSSEVAFVAPPALEDGSPEYGSWLYSCGIAAGIYTDLCATLAGKAPAELESATDRRKWARQAARSVLPECAETKIFVTANARALRHFIELRGSPHADAEIRRLALAVLGVMRREAPSLFGDYELSGGCVSTPHRKV